MTWEDLKEGDVLEWAEAIWLVLGLEEGPVMRLLNLEEGFVTTWRPAPPLATFVTHGGLRVHQA